jgi:hypothetical protein
VHQYSFDFAIYCAFSLFSISCSYCFLSPLVSVHVLISSFPNFKIKFIQNGSIKIVIILPYFCSYKTSFWDLNFMSKVGESSFRRGYKKCQVCKNFLIEFSFFISCPEQSISAQCNRSTVFNWSWR